MAHRRVRSRALRARELAAGRELRQLFEQHGRMIHAICRLRLRDRLDAEDATQQTFLAAYRSLLRDTRPVDPAAWLATIARNECSRFHGRRVVTVAAVDSEQPADDDVPGAVERREEIEAIAAALGELTPSQRDAVVLREFYGLSYAEVSAALGVSGAAVESLLFKGRRRLQEKLVSIRVASVALLPDTVRDGLAQLLPGFGGGAAAAAGSKALAVPAAAKLAVIAVVATGGGATVADTMRRDHPERTREARASTAVRLHARTAPAAPSPSEEPEPLVRARGPGGGERETEDHEDEPAAAESRDERDEQERADDRDEREDEDVDEDDGSASVALRLAVDAGGPDEDEDEDEDGDEPESEHRGGDESEDERSDVEDLLDD